MRFIALLIPALMLAACGGDSKNIPLARDAAAQFHQRLNARDFDAIVADRAETLRRSHSGAELEAVLFSVSAGLGRQLSTEETSASEQVSSGRVVVSLRYLSHHERGDARERFTFEVENGTALLSGYQIERAPPRPDAG